MRRLFGFKITKGKMIVTEESTPVNTIKADILKDLKEKQEMDGRQITRYNELIAALLNDNHQRKLLIDELEKTEGL